MMTTGHPVMTSHTEASTDVLRTNSPALKIHRNERLIRRSEFCSLYHDYSLPDRKPADPFLGKPGQVYGKKTARLSQSDLQSDLQDLLRFDFNLNFSSCHLLHNFR